ncbi:MAG: hypothetical protein D6796_10630, partial [Caldilineae bacterium]
MNRVSLRRLSLALFALLVALLIPTFIRAQTSSPSIPHPLEGRDDCLACHGADMPDVPHVPDNHDGLTSDKCQLCHHPAPGVTAPAATGVLTATRPIAGAEGALPLPHPLAGYENCLQCHLTPEATPVPPGAPPPIPH